MIDQPPGEDFIITVQELPLDVIDKLRHAPQQCRLIWIDLSGELTEYPRQSNVGASDGCLVVSDETSLRQKVAANASLNFAILMPKRLSPAKRRVIDHCVAIASEQVSCRICLISSFSAHFGDVQQLEVEDVVGSQFQSLASCRVTVLRTGHLLGRNDGLRARVRHVAALVPLVSPRWKSCFLTKDELLKVVDQHLGREHWPRLRVITVLGRNRHLRELFSDQPSLKGLARCVHWFCYALAYLGVGKAIGLLFAFIARYRRPWQLWQCDSLEPKNIQELLALYNPFNYHYVAIAGYNTGVAHFGWRYPGKTIVKTTACCQRIRLRATSVEVDAGATLKQVITALQDTERELLVLPNYSYVSMGTPFFVPIHGSASEVATLGETIDQILLYDPENDRIVRAKPNESVFRHAMYDRSSGLLALRLRYRIRKRTRFFVRQEKLDNPSAAAIWEILQDSTAANIELRKSRAAAEEVAVSKYYKSDGDNEDLLEVPRDRIGRLWDRLEENRLTSYLFHYLVRRYGYHVELFLNADQFPVFWAAHDRLPLSKIQLRFVHRDGLPNSPIGHRDCISADLFMKRRDRDVFLAFIREHLPDAKYNPGKHSM